VVDEEAVRIEITMPAPFETVWQAFLDPKVIPEWFGWEYEGLAEEIEMIFGEKIEAWKEGGTLHFGGHLFTLDDHDTETVVRVTREAPAGGNVDWDLYYDDIEEGWTTFLHQLRFALARHPGHTRRTVYLAGFRTGPGAKTTVERLGLAEAAAMVAGQRYRTRTPWGDPMAGKQWFRSTNQLGLTVDQWGDGLLIVFESPKNESSKDSVSAVLTTYGLDDRQFEQVERRWSDWWHANHRAAADTEKEKDKDKETKPDAG
jgi:uncharacterized protein YndB with AHSA1/START domain